MEAIVCDDIKMAEEIVGEEEPSRIRFHAQVRPDLMRPLPEAGRRPSITREEDYVGDAMAR
jgi:hypothetical protein